MVTVISQITLRVGGKRIPAGTPVAISEADAENLSEYITIVSEASVSDEDIPNEEAPNEEAPNEEAPNEEAPNEEAPNEEAPNEEAPNEEAPNEEAPNEDNVSATVAVNTASRGRGRPPITQK